MCTHPGLCLYVLPQQPLLVEGVPGLPCNGVDGTLVNLLFDGTDQQEEGLSNCLLRKERRPSQQTGPGGDRSISSVAGTGSVWTVKVPLHTREWD